MSGSRTIRFMRSMGSRQRFQRRVPDPGSRIPSPESRILSPVSDRTLPVDHSVVAEPRPDPDRRLARADDLALLLEAEHDPELARAVEDLLAHVAPLDLALAGF